MLSALPGSANQSSVDSSKLGVRLSPGAETTSMTRHTFLWTAICEAPPVPGWSSPWTGPPTPPPWPQLQRMRSERVSRDPVDHRGCRAGGLDVRRGAAEVLRRNVGRSRGPHLDHGLE